MNTVNVAKEFTRFPSGRLKSLGGTSGEEFREKFLQKPIANGEEVTVQLDGTIGYSSSFLEEAFGGLVRSLKLSSTEIFTKLRLVSTDDSLIVEVRGYIEDASKRLS